MANSNQVSRPLEHYETTGKINWDRLSNEDRRLVVRWLDEHEPDMAASFRRMNEAFGARLVGLKVKPDFWKWLQEERRKAA